MTRNGAELLQALRKKITASTLANNFNLGDGLETRLELRSDTQKAYAAGLLYSF